jgi:membrane-associated phospholipid phosphatase/drug/metabolite transporter superfamily protein YnfA
MFEELFIGELGINLFLQGYSSTLTTFFAIMITMLGDPFFWITISAILLWFGHEKKSMTIATIIFFNAIVLGILKYSITRPRPNIPRLEEFTTAEAFPSGHVAILTSIYSYFEKKLKGKEKIILIIIIVLNGISRLYLGVHYFSDILFGILIGYVIGKIILRLDNKLEKLRLVIKNHRKKAIPILIALSIIVILFLPNKLFLAITLIGYFIGYLIQDKKIVKLNKNKKIIYGTIGVILLIVLSNIATKVDPILSGTIFLTMGLYITLLWPIIINKIEHIINRS